MADGVCPAGTFALVSDPTALAVVRGPADTGVCQPCLSGGGEVEAASAGGADGTTAARLCVTSAGSQTCGAVLQGDTSVNDE